LLAPASRGGDILRGGVSAAQSRENAYARGRAGAENADIAKTAARDRLARTTEAISAVRRMQQGAAVSSVSVPDGLVPGGLDRAAGLNARWDGALDPVQNGNTVGIKQTKSQAILHWETFNVGGNTIVQFDQSGGKADAGKWIAFNKVFDPGGVPSQILGSIKAEGQVYILNQNGIIFGAGSQVNTRTLVASSLPINDNLVTNGLLNNRDAQFLFSALEVPGGSDGTPPFIPPSRQTPDGQTGDVVVQAGARITSSAGGDGNGGRVMLVGANVKNRGVIITTAGQTILAAGLQVGVQAHAGNDPSLRGLDVWVGEVGTYAGKVTNSGLIEAQTGSILLAGKEINQLGALDSSTSVNLNGRIDVQASYGAVANPDFDNSSTQGFGAPIFFFQHAGTITFGQNSVTRILPDYTSGKTIPGTGLPEDSQINVQALLVRFGADSTVWAPSGNVTVSAGDWPYQDTNRNRVADEAGLSVYSSGGKQRFLHSAGQIYFEPGAVLDVAGTPDAFVPLAQNIVEVQLRGPELADSPLLRASNLRGKALTVDLRKTGVNGGSEWVGTPLGDLTGLAGIVARGADQLTTRGGTISLEAGASIAVSREALLDVSGGFSLFEGGTVRTTRLVRGRTLIDIDQATPDVLYDGIYESTLSRTSAKWGITETFAAALAPLGSYPVKDYVEGAAGGSISLSAPNLQLAGELRGRTIKGPRQLDAPPAGSSLRLAFRSEKSLTLLGGDVRFLTYAPTAPMVTVGGDRGLVFTEPEFAQRVAAPKAIPPGSQEFLLDSALFDESQGGFANLEIINLEGEVVLPKGVSLTLPAGGSFVASAANISLLGDLTIPGGSVDLTAYNFSPYEYEELELTGGLANLPAPAPSAGKGIIGVGEGVRVSVAGMLVDERPTAPGVEVSGRVLDGGSISFEGYSVLLGKNSLLDASGGAWATPTGDFVFGKGGDIAILAGKDPELSTSIGGSLVLEGALQSYSGAKGGSLSLQAGLVEIGSGASSAPDTLSLAPEFFRRGGFTEYNLIGIGGRDASGALRPAVRVIAGTTIEPVAESWVHAPFAPGQGTFALRPYLKPAGLREPASISLQGIGANDSFIPLTGEDIIEAVGIVSLEEGTRILTDPWASVKLSGDIVAVLGEISAPAGSIVIKGGSKFPLPGTLASGATFALPTVLIGPEARLSAAGTAVYLPDPFGRRAGLLSPGGSLSISGNILAEAGAVLDVSGASAVFDFHPTRLADTAVSSVPRNAGINSLPWGRRSVSARVDSDGGLIELRGSEMLSSDATLLGAAGGPTALGGILRVSSGRFYPLDAPRTGADINLVVEQWGKAMTFGEFGSVKALAGLFTRPPADLEAQLALGFSTAKLNSGMGYFTVDSFARGGFDYLDLGFNYNANASPIPIGGNVEFRGAINLVARGAVRLAGGGVIKADAPVSISASSIAVGQEFREPLNPKDVTDGTSPLFREYTGLDTRDYFFTPTAGLGELSLKAGLIDVGTLSLQGISFASLTAEDGDIRGNGTVNIAGDLVLKAAQIYPTTLAEFNIFAYNTIPNEGSVTILASGNRTPPLSAGGSLNIFASRITQAGTLRAPFGSITLGWEGKDFDPSDADFDQPVDPVGGFVVNPLTGNFDLVSAPEADDVFLSSKSVTAISAIDPATGEGLLIPFGLSPDGLSWIDPRGVNVTVLGLPERRVSLAGKSVRMEAGAQIDLRGGGDLLAYRFVPGTGGSSDLLGTATTDWSSLQEYESGDLVLFAGKTWSARVAIDPESFWQSPEPAQNRYWKQVADSYVVLPGFASDYAPFNRFNTGANSGSLAGDPGFTASGIRQGEQVYLEASAGLARGNYTLLPRRYGVLPGAVLVTPLESNLVSSAVPVSTLEPALDSLRNPFGMATTEEGASLVSGYTSNSFNPRASNGLRTRFEVVSNDILQARASYDRFSANVFMAAAAERLGLTTIQTLPTDSASLAIHGNRAIRLEGDVLSRSISGGRGANIDVSSFSDIYVIGGDGSAPDGAEAVLKTDLLNSWGADSLLIGGLRYKTDTGVSVDVRTNGLTLDNPGASLAAPEITLVSRQRLTITEGSSLVSSGMLTRPADLLNIDGEGTLVRVSSDPLADTMRTGLSGSILPLLEIGARATVSGRGVILDSTYASDMDPSINLIAEALTLSSAQISIVLEPQTLPLAGTVVTPHLVLEGNLLSRAEAASALRLFSYRTIDLYGNGSFGGNIESLTLRGAGLRGYGSAGDTFLISAGNVLMDNFTNADQLPASPLVPTATLAVEADTINFGTHTFTVAGYGTVDLTARAGMIADAVGTFSTASDLVLHTSLLTGAQGSNQSLIAGGNLTLLAETGMAEVTPGLGATMHLEGGAVSLGGLVRLPSGLLTAKARTGDLLVSGELNTEGISQNFYDLVRSTDSGEIFLEASAGNVRLLADSSLSVSAPAQGGEAGSIAILAAQGAFSSAGRLQGLAGAGGVGGSFLLDAKSVASFSDLTTILNDGGFNEARSFRIRTGDVTVAGISKTGDFALAADAGSILVLGTIDASGATGGSIALVARDNVTLANGSLLDVSAERFDSAGKGGSVSLEAGAANILLDPTGAPNPAGFVTVAAGSTIDLGVAAYVPGGISTPGSSEFSGQFRGTLHLRAPRVGITVNVNPLEGNIVNPSAVVVEGFKVYDRSSFATSTLLRTKFNTDNIAFMVGEAAMRANLLSGSVDSPGLANALVIAPGVEIIHRTGDLVIGLPGNATGTAPANDWNLAAYRYGSEGSPGILTLRAYGDLLFQNALSDGFAGFSVEQGTPPVGRQLWLANLMTINPLLPTNVQSWSYRLVAGADLSSAASGGVRPLASFAPGSDSGSLRLGNFYANTNLGGSGANATTAAAIAPGAGTTTRFQVIRTGTGDIQISTARDVELRNQFATIYTAGVRIPDATQIFAAGDFSVPVVERDNAFHPDQSALGANQQIYPPQWAVSGGSIAITAGADIRRVTRVGLATVTDSSRQLPTNWLYRRGYVDPTTGIFGLAGVDSGISTVSDPSGSTTWWVDYSNFFEGVGALGGGNITMEAGRDIINADAVIPTNARMAGLSGGLPIAPGAANLLEYGGGDLLVQAGRNVDGGIYYVEKGAGRLVAGGEITTNASRSPSLNLITGTPQILDPLTWLPTTLFAGRSSFDVSARGNVLLGPVANVNLLPQGLNNKFWYKTYFQTYGESSAVDVSSLGGDVTLRLTTVLPGTTASRSILQAWIERQNLFASNGASTRASNTQPWIRIAETQVAPFATALTVAPPTLRSTAFSGALYLVGAERLFPSSQGTLELAAAGGVIGLNPSGVTAIGSPAQRVVGWTTALLNLSDADALTIPGVTNPFSYQQLVGRDGGNQVATQTDFLAPFDQAFNETASYSGENSSIQIKRSLHAITPVHLGDLNPLRIYSLGGDITGLSLFSSKFAQIYADRDITDIAFSIQNLGPDTVSIVSAGRDIVPYNENTELRTLASDLTKGNFIADPAYPTVLLNANGAAQTSRILAGDIQISGPGYLEVLAGRNIDLGTGPNFLDGTGAGITSVANARNPFLPSGGASLVLLAGVGGLDKGPALGLTGSSLDLESLLQPASTTGSEEVNAIVALQSLFDILRRTGKDFAVTGSYEEAYAAIGRVFGTSGESGDIFTRARDVRTTSGGAITLAAPRGSLSLASDIFGNPLTPPGIVTEYGGEVSILTDGDVDIGQARIFTLRGGDLVIWSSSGDIAAGTAPKTVVTAPPTRVIIDSTSAEVQTDLGGLATGGGIGVLASVEGVEPGSVVLLAPLGTVDAGDAGIRATGDITIAAASVINADNISAGGSTVGVPTAAVVAAPNIAGLSSASSATGAANSSATQVSDQARQQPTPEQTASIIAVEVLGYGGAEEG